MRLSLSERDKFLQLLRKPDIVTLGATVLLSLMQITMSMTISGFTLGFFVKVLMFGAPLSHGLYMLSLEFANNLCFGNELLDRAGAVLGNFATGIPYAELVRYFDAEHRAFYNSKVYRDPDKPGRFEREYVKGAGLKIAYLCAYPAVYLYRLLFRHSISFNRFLMFNIIWQSLFNMVILYSYGFMSLFYLLCSTYVGMCPLHPFAAHLLMQHNRLEKTLRKTNTYSYYGIVNPFTFNAGYHRERHREKKVPWSNLPMVKRLYGEDRQKAHYTSTLQAIHDFVFTPSITLGDNTPGNTSGNMRGAIS
jgi:sphingolipid delta-4 desaturase